MKTENPQEQIEYVANLLKDAQERGAALYYSIKVERFGGVFPVAERESGQMNFINHVTGSLIQHQPNAIIIELFSAKAKNVKEPLHSFKITVHKKNLPDKPGKIEVTQAQPEIPYERFMQEQLNLKMIQLEGNFDKRVLQFTIDQKEEKIKELDEALKERDAYISELEAHLEQEPETGLSLGKIHLGEIGTYIAENVLKRNPKILKEVLKLSDEQFAGIWTEDEQGEPGENKTASTVKIKPKENLSEVQEKHLQVVGQISAYLKSITSGELRKIYELLACARQDKTLLDKIISFIQSQKQP